MLEQFKQILRDYMSLARPAHYIKNVVIFLPMVVTASYSYLPQFLISFAIFSVAASGIYAINDAIDMDRDSRHVKKKFRPVASGRISKQSAIVFGFICCACSAAVAVQVLNSAGAWVIAIYLMTSTFYSVVGKDIPILDIIIISVGFVLRVQLGIAEIPGASALQWLLLPTFVLALTLAVGKRVAKQAGDGNRNIMLRIPKYYTLPRLVGITLALSHLAVLVAAWIFLDRSFISVRDLADVSGTSFGMLVIGVIIFSRIVFLMVWRHVEPAEIIQRDVITSFGSAALILYIIVSFYTSKSMNGLI